MVRRLMARKRRTPIPPVASEYPAGMWYGDTFQSYADTAALLANMATSANSTELYGYADATDKANIALDTSFGFKTMRFDQPSGTTASPEIEVWFNGPFAPTAIDNCWARWTARFSPGWTTAGTGGNAESYKWVFLGQPSPNTRIAFLYGGTEGALTPELILQGDAGSGGSFQPYLPDPVDEWDGTNWYTFTIHYRRYSNRRARYRAWRNVEGQTPVLLFDLDGDPSPVNAYNTEGVWSFLLGRNFNKTRTQSQSIYWKQWAVYDGATAPNPFGLGAG